MRNIIRLGTTLKRCMIKRRESSSTPSDIVEFLNLFQSKKYLIISPVLLQTTIPSRVASADVTRPNIELSAIALVNLC